LLTWLSDNGQHNGVTVVATTNHPDWIDPAFLSRFQVLPVLRPTADEAAEVMRIQATRDGRGIDVAEVAAELRRAQGTMSRRTAVGRVERAGAYGGRPLAGADIRQALDDLMLPEGSSDELQALQAIAHTTWKPHLPWQAARALNLPVDIPSYVEPLLNEFGE